jgi:predicted nucleic acid-binding protein
LTRCYVDTNFLFAYSRRAAKDPDPRLDAWRQQVDHELGSDPGVISGLVFDELAYRAVLTWLRDAGDTDPMSTFRKSAPPVMRRMRGRLRRLWRAIEEMDFEIAVTDRSVTRHAIELMSDPGLSPRDAFHAAHALDSGCPVIVSSDPDYDRLAGLRRVGPANGR